MSDISSSGPSQGIPGTPNQQLVDANLNVTPPWWAFFVNLYARTGGPSGSISVVLDGITNIVGSLLFRGANGWIGLRPSAIGNVLQMGSRFPLWGLLTGANFADVAHNEFLAGPLNGIAPPTFRPLATSDFVSLEGQFPGTATNDNAAAGNVGEYISSTVASGAAIALATGTPADITSIALTDGDWDVWGSVGLSANSTTVNAWISSAPATDPGSPNSGAYARMGNQAQAFPLGSIRVSLATPTTWYLSLNATFAGALNAYGFIGARRRR